MKTCVWLVLAVAFCFSLALGTDANLKKDQRAILQLHAREREGHLKGDADLVTSGIGSTLTVVENGQVETKTRKEIRDRFSNYFSTVKYSSWDDAITPAVHVSSDGSMAWAAIQIKARYQDRSGPQVHPRHEFLSSWIATYEKQGSKWYMIAISSGCDPPCTPPKSDK